MVTFYRPTSKEARERFGAVVWNPQANAPLADFSLAGGKFDTDDPKVISRLRELGYPEVGAGEKPPEAPVKSNWVKSSEVGKGSSPLKRRGRKPATAPVAVNDMDAADVSPR